MFITDKLNNMPNNMYIMLDITIITKMFYFKYQN